MRYVGLSCARWGVSMELANATILEKNRAQSRLAARQNSMAGFGECFEVCVELGTPVQTAARLDRIFPILPLYIIVV